MTRRRAADPAWAWFASKTPDCAPLDDPFYASDEFAGRSIPWPEWACRAPDGGVHVDARCSQVHVRVVRKPSDQLEFGWTCNFGVRLIARRWLSLIEDLVEEPYTFIGDVVAAGRRLDDWSTLHGRLTPPLLSSEGSSKTCPICGDVYAMIRGRTFFADPRAREMPLIVNRSGLFIRKDIFERRDLPTPAGAFRPLWVRLDDDFHQTPA